MWQDEQQQTFDLLRTELIKNTRELGYFDRKSPTVLYTDASPVGLGAVLIQLQEKSDGKRISRIIAFASKALTDTEKRRASNPARSFSISLGGRKILHLFIRMKIQDLHRSPSIEIYFW